MVGGRTLQSLGFRFCDQKEFRTISVQDEKALRDWRASNPKEFGQSKNVILNALKDNKNKRQKKCNHSKSSETNAHVQSVATKLINEKTKGITNDSTTKKVLFAASKADG